MPRYKMVVRSKIEWRYALFNAGVQRALPAARTTRSTASTFPDRGALSRFVVLLSLLFLYPFLLIFC